MWAMITLAGIVVVVSVSSILITLPMCKDYDEIYFEENGNEMGAPTDKNSGISAFNKK